MTILMVLLVPVIGTEHVWMSDVGAQLAQSERLVNGDGWLFDHPLPQLDPSGQWFPFQLAGKMDTGYVVLGKHRLFTWFVAALFHLGGLGAVMIASVIWSAVAARLVVASVSSIVSKSTQVALLWVTAVASPIGFASYLGYAHTMAACCAVAAFLLATRWCRDDKQKWMWLLASQAAIALGPMVRSEATLVGIAIGLGLLAAAPLWPEKAQRRRLLTVGGASLITTVVSYMVDARWALSSDFIIASNDPPIGWLAGRWQGFEATWLWSSVGGAKPTDIFLFLTPVVWVYSGYVRHQKPRQAVALIGLGALFLTATVAVDSSRTVPGLLVAFPFFIAALSWMTPKHFRHPIPATAALIFVLYAGAVIATQYPQGGSAEWGGRYFIAGLPLGLVAVAPGVDQLLKVRVLGLVAVVASVALTGTGFANIHRGKQNVGRLEATVTAVSDDCGTEPVYLSTVDQVGRWLWASTADAPWLLVPDDQLDVALRRTSQAQLNSVVVVSNNAERELPPLSTYDHRGTTQPIDGIPIDVVVLCAP